jgi:hypothetical protein
MKRKALLFLLLGFFMIQGAVSFAAKKTSHAPKKITAPAQQKAPKSHRKRHAKSPRRKARHQRVGHRSIRRKKKSARGKTAKMQAPASSSNSGNGN